MIMQEHLAICMIYQQVLTTLLSQYQNKRSQMADPNKYKSLSVPKKDWEELGVLANKTNRTRSKMIGRLIRFFKENKGDKKNGKET
tara:strand:+ start:19 stop:276 length:258 start_codon:yes stop_codon:yes gene_type:complete